MLKLENIKKNYSAGSYTVEALKGVSLEFRKNEFVSILGPSGCGKTTMLNIIGGLDRYSSGDLIIDEISTKHFRDRDWDTYRNNRIGFVFQSYNLIPHQTVLGNVELALTIAGMGKSERTAKAKAALDKVGLGDQYTKRPNQLSGGQMQRVAIARALVNDPEILLADEPTGALDTVTSTQIMDLLKEVAKDRLVIMVTHNAELSEKYSTRIIKLLDGKLLDDSDPYTKNEVIPQQKTKQAKAAATTGKTNPTEASRKKHAKMSFFTAFKLSLQNLISKRRRSIMVSVAGSIGIIGVALVLAFSFGIQGFITSMQRDMLSGNPITVEKTTFDLNALISGMGTSEKMKATFKDGFANIDSMVEQLSKRAETMQNIMVENTITEDYVKFVEDMPAEYLAALHYDYGLDVSTSIFTTYRDHESPAAKNERLLSLAAIRTVFGALLAKTELADYASLLDTLSQSFVQLPANADEYILSQYNLVYGDKIASKKNEVMIVLGEDRMLADLMLAQLGYYSQQEFLNTIYEVTEDKTDDAQIDPDIPDRNGKISYEDLVGKTFTWYKNDDLFSKNSTSAPQAFDYIGDAGINAENIINPSDEVELKIVGILEPKKNMSFGMLENGFYYTTALAEYIIEHNQTSEIVQYVTDWNNLSRNDQIIEAGGDPTNPTDDTQYKILYTYACNYKYPNQPAVPPAFGIGPLSIKSEGSNMFGGIMSMFRGGGISIQSLGGSQLPYFIGIYPANLEIKPKVLTYLDRWNLDEDLTLSDGTVIPFLYNPGQPDEYQREDITYSDPLSLIFNMITQMVNLITIALVAFTSLALVVSCVMIGIITYVSVVERIKEIGVIRSLGGRKRDVSNLFTAETVILGFTSGLFGIIVTYILSAIVNIIVNTTAGIATIAALPLGTALVMITLSVVLTLISGLMPSRSAAKKDPVVALRTE